MLDAVCDTLLPAIETSEPGPAGDLLRRGARERGIPAHVAAAIPALLSAPRAALLALLDELAAEQFAAQPLERRTARLLELGDRLPDGRFAVKQLKTMTFGLLFGLLGEDGRNEVWDAIGFAGPITAPPTPEQAPKTLPITQVGGGEATLTADVVVVGSGAGGSVIAARLAQAGRSVLVLERGPYRNEADFRQLESAAGEMYLGGGMVWSEHGELGLLAGSTLGGGTVINSMVCLRTPQEIRADWAAFGLDGLDGPDYDRWQQTVWEALEVNTEATRHNASSRRMIAGLSELGHGHEPLPRNVTLDDDPRFCGYCNSGCQQGCKRSTQKNYLQEAADAGARFVVGCHVERVLVEDGRAAGVAAVVHGEDGIDAPDGAGADGRDRRRRDRVAGGAAALRDRRPRRRPPPARPPGVDGRRRLRRAGQGLGGPDPVGRLVRLHARRVGRRLPLRDARPQPRLLGRPVAVRGRRRPSRAGAQARPRRRLARRLARSRQRPRRARRGRRGAGAVVARRRGRPRRRGARPHRAGADPPRRRRQRGLHLRLEAAALARGEDVEAFEAQVRATPADQFTAYSAHQMGSCRLGADPQAAVADGDGQLHDVRGVWIGDAAALPTAPGVNPMITIMALAERTAAKLIEAGA